MIKEKIKNFVCLHKEEMVKDLMDLIRIPSVSTDRRACREMLLSVKALYEKHGFETELYEEYLLAYYGEGKESIGLFAHGDVVDAGSGWTLTKNAFEPVLYDNFLVGRGAIDDKSAIVCSLYTLIALRELGLCINKRIVCFTGSNEENGMSDIVEYKKTHTPPVFSYVLDAAFPLYYGDKGKIWLKIKSQKAFKQIKDFFGGKMINIILGEAELRMGYSSDIYKSCEKADRLTAIKEDAELIIRSKGVSSHGANPEGSINGAVLIAKALENQETLNIEDRKILSNFAHILSSYYGETVGIANNDTRFGALTMTNGRVNTEDGHLAFTLDIRFGKDVEMENMIKHLSKTLDEYGFDTEVISKDDAYCTEPNNEYILRSLYAYKNYTGKNEAPIYINAGSTYARHIGDACEIGTSYEGKWLSLPQGHGNCHQPDEYIDTDGMAKALELTVFTVSEVAR